MSIGKYKKVLESLDAKDSNYVALARSTIIISTVLAVIAYYLGHTMLLGSCIGMVSASIGLLIQVYSNNIGE